MSSSNTTGLSVLQQSMAERAARLKEQINQPTASRLTINDNGEFVGADGMILGPEVDMVVVDFISANRWYPRPYNPNNVEPPACFAFGRYINEMAPHETSPEPQSALCAGCPKNEFGSDARGTGKACKNTRELAVITHDQFDLPPEEQKILSFSVSPSGLSSFDAAVRYIFRNYESEPIRVLIRASVVKKPTHTYASFQPTDEQNPSLEEHFARIPEVEELLFRYPDVSKYGQKPVPQRKAAPPKR